MSDCSTESMKPKEPPKTCGTCGNCVAIVGHCDDSNDRVDLYDQSCENWTPRTDDPEQRFHQLKQVAKKLYRRCWKEAARKSSALSTFMRNAHADDDMRPYREQLEALGVSVDD